MSITLETGRGCIGWQQPVLGGWENQSPLEELLIDQPSFWSLVIFFFIKKLIYLLNTKCFTSPSFAMILKLQQPQC